MIGPKAKLTSWLWYAAEVLPVLAPAAIAVFGSVAIIFLVAGQFKPVYIWPLGLAAAAMASFFIVRYYPEGSIGGKARHLCNVLVIAGVFAWGGVNILYTSQHVLVNRDPALYANAGIWLAKHDSLKIPTDHTFGDVPGVQLSNGSGFKTLPGSDKKYVYAQGLHLLPAFLGLVGRVVGVAKALHLNVVFGMSALLGIYAFGRVLVRHTWWAAVVTGAIALSMPFINFARDSYSEPLAATFTFGGLALLWVALKSQRLSIWFLAGFVAGAGTMTRLDGFLTVAEMLAFLTVVLIIITRVDRVRAARQSVVFIVGMALTSVLGWLDVSRLSAPYFEDLHSQFHGAMLTIAVIIVLGSIAVWLAWSTSLVGKLDRVTRSWRAEMGAVIVLSATILLVSRPLWYRPIDVTTGQRQYTEQSTQWVSWYIGSALAALGAVGIALAIARILKKRDMLMVAGLIVVVGTTLLYLINPGIAPDQIWASRRTVPVILPGVAVFAALTLSWLSEQYLHKVRWGYFFAGLASVAIVLTPLIISKPQLKLRSFTELAAMNDVCAAVPANAAILWVGNGPSQQITQPTRSVCGIPSQGYLLSSGTSLNNFVLATLAKNAEAHHRVPIIGTYAEDTPALPRDVRSHMKPVATFTIQQLEHTLIGPPEKTMTSNTVIELGKIWPNGAVQPLE